MADGYSITIIVGAGIPGHASIEISGPNTTTYTGFGPIVPDSPYSYANYSYVTLPNGVSPVGVLGNPSGEFRHFVGCCSTIPRHKYRVQQRHISGGVKCTVTVTRVDDFAAALRVIRRLAAGPVNAGARHVSLARASDR